MPEDSQRQSKVLGEGSGETEDWVLVDGIVAQSRETRGKAEPALFMTVRREIMKSPSELGKHGREGSKRT